jgi:hypothetical protein
MFPAKAAEHGVNAIIFSSCFLLMEQLILEINFADVVHLRRRRM